MTSVCKNDYDDWLSTLIDAESAFKMLKVEVAGAPVGPDAGKIGVLRESIAYDDRWRVLASRVDIRGKVGPTSATLVSPLIRTDILRRCVPVRNFDKA